MVVYRYLLSACLLALATAGLQAQDLRPLSLGDSLGVRSATGDFTAKTVGVKVYGGIVSAESCVVDEDRDLIIILNRGVDQQVRPNDAWFALLHADATVHTPYWIGSNPPGDRTATEPALVLNDPLGSELANGVLYAADWDGGTQDTPQRSGVLRRFDVLTGAPLGNVPMPGAPWINDLAVAEDGTIYVTQTGEFGEDADPMSWRVWRILPDETVEVFAEGPPLFQPNGVTFDQDGNLVVVNVGDPKVFTYSPEGELLKTEEAAQAGSDGIVVLPDGTKYVCSVTQGGVSRIAPGRPAELIAEGVAGAASMCYDAKRNRLLIPMTSQSGLAVIELDEE